MVAPVKRYQSLFRLYRLFQEPHVVLFLEAIQSQYCPQNGRRFHTNEHRPVDTAGNDRSFWCDYEQIHCMLIYLTNECRRSNGKYKRFWGHALMRKMFEAGAGISDESLLGNLFEETPD